MKRYGFVYLTKNMITGKIYIGQKKYARQNDIADPRPSYIGSGRKILNSIKKHGACNFERTILCWCYNQQGMDDAEKFFIKHYDSTNENIGYNICEGGQTRIPKELLNLFGEANPNFGNRWSYEQKEALRDKALKRNTKGERNPNFGNKWSDEAKRKASERAKSSGLSAGINNPRATSVLCVEDGVVYDMISDVAKANGLAVSTVSQYITKGKKIKGKTYIKNNNSPS